MPLIGVLRQLLYSLRLPAICMLKFLQYSLGRARRTLPDRNSRPVIRRIAKRSEAIEIDDRLDLGETVWNCMLSEFGDEFSRCYLEAVAEGSGGVRLPKEFWANFFEHERNLVASRKLKMQALRALRSYLKRHQSGAKSRLAWREHAVKRVRRTSTNVRPQRARGLDKLLWDVFVD